MNGPRSWKLEVGTTPSMIAPSLSINLDNIPVVPTTQQNLLEAGGTYLIQIGSGKPRLYWIAEPSNIMCLITPGNYPTHGLGVVEVAGVHWLALPMSRRALDVTADDLTPVFITEQSDANETGLKLDDVRAAYTYTDYQGAVWAKTESGTATISVKDR